MSKTRLRKSMALLLALIMVIGLLPAAAAADPPEAAPHQYLSNIAWNRTHKDTNQLFMKSDEFPYITPFEFKAEVTEYDIILVEGVSDAALRFEATFTDGAKNSSNVYGRLTDVSQTGSEAYNNKFLYGAKASKFAIFNGSFVGR